MARRGEIRALWLAATLLLVLAVARLASSSGAPRAEVAAAAPDQPLCDECAAAQSSCLANCFSRNRKQPPKGAPTSWRIADVLANLKAYKNDLKERAKANRKQ